jgi:riboflavin kinase/FMN adenylyltransferase
MDVVAGVDGLRADQGPIFAVVGVFDGLHLGHAYLLDALVREAQARGARPCAITFDHHPDEILTGSAPPLLIDPDERLERLAGAGVSVTVIQHFDDIVRHLSYDAFVDRILARVRLAGLLMTPDAAFGFERRGTPEALSALGREAGFDVVVVPPFRMDGRPVSSSEIRAAIKAGDLDRAARLLGRPVTFSGVSEGGVLRVTAPHARPPDGDYRANVGDASVVIHLESDGRWSLVPAPPDGPVTVALGPVSGRS